MDAKLVARFGRSEHGNFGVVDTLGVPHSYCIGAKHIAFAADHAGGILNEDTIERAERAGATCRTCRGNLKWKDHKVALLVACELPMGDPDNADKVHPELYAYLLACKEKLTSETEYEGFAFVDKTGQGAK